MEKQSNSFEKIYAVIRDIPEGKVASYGQIAALAGNRRWARVVGYALHACRPEDHLPWHRVVKKDGSLPYFVEVSGSNLQRSLLESEEVRFKEGKVDMVKCQWETPWEGM